MKEAKIYAMFNTLKQAVVEQDTTIETLRQNTNGGLGNMQTRSQFVIMYVNSLMEYMERYWIIPIGFFPGNKLFARIYKRNIDNYQAGLMKRKQAAAEAQRAMMDAQKEKANENKKVSNKNERGTDKQVADDSTSDKS